MVEFTEEYKARTAAGANVAERACEEYLSGRKNIAYYKLGFDETNNNISEFYKVPKVFRGIPDFLVISDKANLLECKGFKHKLKLKLDDMQAYNFWNNLTKLYVFIYSTMDKSHKIIEYDKLCDIAYTCKMNYYQDNGKGYYEIDWRLI